MYTFIHYIRAIATVLITNSHYGDIWPISAMAAGGMLGNILFFAASGFCLFNVKENFGKWYLKRFLRIYPVMILFTLLTILGGGYTLQSGKDAVRLFLFPTNYVFIVWLMVAYVAFYWVAWFSKKYKNFTEITLAVVAGAWLLTYLIFVDKSVYHIDEVHKPFILFLYFASMLMGALFKKYSDKFEKLRIRDLVFLFLALIVYFGTKIVFSKVQKIAFLQIINQFSILVVLYFMFAVAIGLEEKLKKLPKPVNAAVGFLAKITLHIYIVQFVVINRLETLIFPLNFLATTAGILALAILLYYAEYFIRKGILCFIDKAKGKKENAESND